MEIVYFVFFVTVCAFVVMWAMGRSRKKADAARTLRSRARQAQTDKLSTPSSYTLSQAETAWQTRRNAASSGVSRTNAFVARSLGQDPEYDGYSRRDRHHVRDRRAQIKGDGHAAEPKVGSIDLKPRQARG